MNALTLLRHGLPLGIVLRGLIAGGALALAAVGVALVYRIDRVVNFAQAGIGGVAGVCAVGLSSHYGWPWFLSFPVGALTGAALGALLSVAIIDRMRARPRLAVTVATVGVAEILAGAAALLATAMPVRAAARTFAVPWDLDIRMGPVLFHADALLAVATAVAVFAGFEAWFGTRRSGLAFRAASEDPDRARLAGIPVARLAALAWALAGVLAAVSVMLQTQLQGVSAGFALVPGGAPTLLRVLAAAVLGGMGNLRRTFAAALAIGLLDEIATWTYGRTIYVDMILVGLVVAVLLASREARARRSRSSGAELASREARPLDRAVVASRAWRAGRFAGIALIGVVGLTVPLWVRPSQAHAMAVICVYAMLALSLLVLTGWAGQVSLGQFAIAGLGGAVTSVLYGRHGWDVGLALVAGVAIAAIAAVLLGLPALRLQGPFFAVTTLGFAVVAANYLFDHSFVPWLVQERVTRPVLWERVSLASEKAMYVACFAMLVVSVIAVVNLRRSRFGRMVIAVRENEASAAATGLRPARAKMAAFAVAGGLAGLAGGMYVLLQEGLQVDAFAPEASLRLFAVVVVGGLVSVGGVIGGAVLIRGTELLLPAGWALLASGAGITALVALFPEGLGGAFARVRDRIAHYVVKDDVVTKPMTSRQTENGAARGRTAGNDPVLLSIDDLVVDLGGTTILDRVSFDVADGELLALLGTNGAGKTTLLRALTGLVTPSGGTLRFDGVELGGADPAKTFGLGMAYAPGAPHVYDGLTVAENLRAAGWRYRGESDALQAAIDDALEVFPALRPRLAIRAGELSGGERQLLNLAEALLSRPRLLLLDELSLGLSPSAAETVLDAVRRINDRGTTVVFVEQSVDRALRLARRAVYIDRGQVRYNGPTAELRDNPGVLRAAFFGDPPPRRRRPRMSTATDVALAADSVALHYGGVVAVDGVSIEVRAGEIVALVGPNGAGKTSLLDVLAGAVRPDTGRVLFEGRDVTSLPAYARARLGIGRSFQDARLWPALTVREAVATARERHVAEPGVAPALARLPVTRASEAEVDTAVDRLLDEFGLTEFVERFVGELSTGMRRALELACLMAGEPTVLLLDEPAAGLAQRELPGVGARLTEVHRRSGAAMVIVEHDLPLVRQIAQRVIVLVGGAVIADGDPRTVFDLPEVQAAYFASARQLTP